MPAHRSLRCAFAAPVAALIVAASLLCACGAPYPHGSFDELYPQSPRPTQHVLSADGHAVRTVEMAGSGSTPIVFVHGSPGDWKVWARYLNAPELAGYGPRISFDRPGFGDSEPGHVITDLHAQALLLNQLLPTDKGPAIVVGHSLGGPLAAWMAIEAPQKICGLVMVAGSVAPQHEAPRWYNRLADTRLAHWLLPEFMLVSNTELMALPGELRKLDAAWSRLRRPLVAIQGEHDSMVIPQEVDHLAQRVPTGLLRIVRVPEQGHFVVWDRMDIVINAIRSLDCGCQPTAGAQQGPG